MILPFTFGLALGLMIAGVFYLAWNAERHINETLREHFAGEEERNSDSYDAGVRNGQLFSELGVSYLGDYRAPQPAGQVYADGTTDTGWGGFGGREHTPELFMSTKQNDPAA